MKFSITKRGVATPIVALVAVAAFAGIASAGTAHKATGDVYADRTAAGVGIAHMVFVAQETNPAKGTFTYSDLDGTYTFNVEAVKVAEEDANFAGTIVSSNRTDLFQVGQVVGIAVHDGGESGIKVDLINGMGYDSLAHAVEGFATLTPDGALTASAGNLQVN